MRRRQNQNPEARASFASGRRNQHKRNGRSRGRAIWLGWRRCARLFSALAGNGRECRSVELRALCNEVPRTPPGPEGSNGTGIASGAADHPKFLSLKTVNLPMSYQVIARKWRPQTFDDLVGQQHLTETLKNAIKNDP